MKDLCGNRLLQNHFINTFCKTRLRAHVKVYQSGPKWSKIASAWLRFRIRISGKHPREWGFGVRIVLASWFRVFPLCFLLPTETKFEGGTSQGESETSVKSSNSGEFRDADRLSFRVQGYRMWTVWFQVCSFRVSGFGSGFRVHDFGFQVSGLLQSWRARRAISGLGLGCRIEDPDFGFRVQDFGIQAASGFGFRGSEFGMSKV